MDAIFSKYKISSREREIVDLICKGKTNKQIEKELFISLDTVKSHIYHIYKKIGVRSRIQLINFFNTFKD